MNHKEVNTLHLFDNYLPITENWAYRLLKSTPNTSISIFAKQYIYTDFYTPDFKYVDHLDNYLLGADLKLNKNSFYDILLKTGIKILRKFSPGSVKALSKHLEEHHYDIVHAHFANIGWEFLRAVREKRIPYVISLYGWDYEKLPFTQPEYIQYFQILFKQCAAIICEGPYGASTLIKAGCPQEKIRVIHLGLDCETIPFFKRSKNQNELHLIQIAAFSPTKGYLEAINAFAQASKNCPNMTYTIVGVERYKGHKEEIQKLIEALGLPQKIKILPKIDYKELHTFLSNFQVFIHPSQYTPEKDCEGGAPIIILDAQCTGMPILSTTHCDIPNEVEHLKTGLLSKERDIEGLAKNIERFYQMDQAEYDEMSRQARKKIEEEFDVSRSGKELEAVYRAIKIS